MWQWNRRSAQWLRRNVTDCPFHPLTPSSLGLMPPFVRPIGLPGPPFYPKAGRRAVRFEIGRVDHDRLAFGSLRCRQAFHHADEDAFVAPPLPAIVERLCRAIFRSEEPPYALQSLMRISYAVFCLKKKKTHNNAMLYYTYTA